jgi:hypothetical protein
VRLADGFLGDLPGGIGIRGPTRSVTHRA